MRWLNSFHTTILPCQISSRNILGLIGLLINYSNSLHTDSVPNTFHWAIWFLLNISWILGNQSWITIHEILDHIIIHSFQYSSSSVQVSHLLLLLLLFSFLPYGTFQYYDLFLSLQNECHPFSLCDTDLDATVSRKYRHPFLLILNHVLFRRHQLCKNLTEVC